MKEKITIPSVVFILWIFLTVTASLYMFINLYSPTKCEEIVEGYWTPNYVCVDISDMNFKEALETCKHEIGHEIFAELCGDNWEKCMEIFGR